MIDYEELAEEVAFMAHGGQTDKGGRLYIEHLRVVAAGVGDNTTARTVAYLHDVVEDTAWTLDMLKAYFPPHIVDAVACLTRRKRESYDKYITRLKPNPLARVVKMADLRHNMDISRIPNPTVKDKQRLRKYRKALVELEDHK